MTGRAAGQAPRRRRSGDYKLRNAARSTARQAALSALARAHPGEFAVLYQMALERAGLAAPRPGPVSADLGALIHGIATALAMPPDAESEAA